MNAAMKNRTGVSNETAVTGEMRVDQRTKRPRRWLVVEFCACGERLPHLAACEFTLDPEICS